MVLRFLGGFLLTETVAKLGTVEGLEIGMSTVSEVVITVSWLYLS